MQRRRRCAIALDDGSTLTLFVRPSTGVPRFDLFKTGALRVCIWQDEVVGAVMMGEMSAGQMMRVAQGAAYAALELVKRNYAPKAGGCTMWEKGRVLSRNTSSKKGRCGAV